MRLIDADALKARWYKINDIDENDRGARFVGYCEIAGMIDNAPTVDAVEVVRCKDCKHAYKRKQRNKTAVLCELFGAGMKDDDFCSCGERSEE